MNVDTAQLGQVNDCLGKEFSVGNDDNQFRSEGRQLLQNALLTELFRLQDGNIVSQRHSLYWRRQQLHSPVFWLIRLGVDGSNVMSVRNQPFQRRNGELRRSHKDDSHQD